MDYDVIVAGGGTAGSAAALAAARLGAHVLLLERNGVLGGTATSGLMVSWGVRGRFWDGLGDHVVTGIPWEIHRCLVERGSGHPAALRAESAPFKMVFEPEALKGLLIDLFLDAGVEILTHTMACDPVLDGRTIGGLYIENKSGRALLRAPCYVDCTGDMDICRRAGIHTGTAPGGHTIMMRVGGVDQDRLIRQVEQQGDEVQDSEEGMYRRQDIFDNYYNRGYLLLLGYTGTRLGNMTTFSHLYEDAVREGVFSERELEFHRLVADGEITEGDWGIDMQGVEGRAGTDIVDIWAAARFFDGCNAREVSRFEIEGHRRCRDYFEHVIRRLPGFERSHILEIAADAGIRGGVVLDCDYQFTGEDIERGARHDDCIGRWAKARFWDPEAMANPVRGVDIPLRALLPRQTDNLLVAGRYCGCLRAMTSCMVMGQGAGIAAALAAEKGVAPRDLAGDKLRAAAQAQNVNVG